MDARPIPNPEVSPLDKRWRNKLLLACPAVGSQRETSSTLEVPGLRFCILLFYLYFFSPFTLRVLSVYIMASSLVFFVGFLSAGPSGL